jgi:CheY-like chemotaxis protein
MSNLILVISEDCNANAQMSRALATTAPDCRLEFACSREQIRGLPKPAVILLDFVSSNEPAALDVLQWLRTENRFQEVPVIVLGSEIADHDVNRAYALGANSFLLKGHAPEAFEPIAQGIATYASLMAAQP